MLQPTEDEQFVVDAVRRFVQARVEPEQAAWDEAGTLPDDIGPELAELGLCALLLDESRGGAGFGFEVATAAVRTLARGDAALAWVVASHNLALRAAPRDLDLAPWVEGRRWMTIAAPVAAGGDGGDIAALFGPPTHVARVGAGETILEPLDAAAANPMEPRLGLRAARLGVLAGAPGSGAGTSVDRIAALNLAASLAIGLGGAALDDALGYARERRQFGRPLADFQGLQFRLADRATDLEAAEALVRWSDVAPDADRARRGALLAVRAAKAAAHDAVQIFGGVGFVREYPVEKRLRDIQTVEGFLVRPRRLARELAPGRTTSPHRGA
jgi:alkylation response protein AidB-like acyl-CoA dehydrogenase